MKLSLRIKTIKIILCILLVLFMLKALETLNPKKKAEYCMTHAVKSVEPNLGDFNYAA